MGVFKLDRETTKCKIVFLSNLCEINRSKPKTISHNQAMYCGPCLNFKISTALINFRFDDKLLCFDLEKVFNQINCQTLMQINCYFFGTEMCQRTITLR
jgi:hypothetical protein